MTITFAAPQDIDGWMELVRQVRDSFPGLETEQALAEHRRTVLEFMARGGAICARCSGQIVGALLFSGARALIAAAVAAAAAFGAENWLDGRIAATGWRAMFAIFMLVMAVYGVIYLLAARLLHGSESSILTISDEVGFENLSYFNRSFKQRYGVTPSQYRKNVDGSGSAGIL